MPSGLPRQPGALAGEWIAGEDTFNFDFTATVPTEAGRTIQIYDSGTDSLVSHVLPWVPGSDDDGGNDGGSDTPITEPLQPPPGLTKEGLIGLISNFKWLTTAQKDAWIDFAEDHSVGELYQAMTTNLGPTGAFNNDWGNQGGWPPGFEPDDPFIGWPGITNPPDTSGDQPDFGTPGNNTLLGGQTPDDAAAAFGDKVVVPHDPLI